MKTVTFTDAELADLAHALKVASDHYEQAAEMHSERGDFATARKVDARTRRLSNLIRTVEA